MTTNLHIPAHLRTLKSVWACVFDAPENALTAALPITTDRIDPADLSRFQELASLEMDALQSWVVRVTEWINGPLAHALNDAAIKDHRMRHVSGRVAHFVDELIERRQGLAVQAHTPAMRAAAPRLDAVYASLLAQTRDFIGGVVAALHALDQPEPGIKSENIELSFNFCPRLDESLAEYSDWIAQASAEWSRAAVPALTVSDPAATDRKTSTPPAVEFITVLTVMVWLALAFAFPGFTILGTLLVLLVVFVLRHPIAALLGVILGSIWD